MPGRRSVAEPALRGRVPRSALLPIGLVAGLLLALAVGMILVFSGRGDTYTVHAEFTNAGQLVNGNLVQVAGVPIGKIADITLTPDGLANVEMTIEEERYDPLHRGTSADIRTTGLSAITGRFVELSPGPQGAPEIEDGGVIEEGNTQSIVDLDAVLNALDPEVRSDLQGIITDGSALVEGDAPQDFNRALAYFNPATAQIRALMAEIVSDRGAVRELISSSSVVAGALASRRSDIEAGIGNAAQAFRAIADEREALESTLSRAPDVLRRGRRTLGGVRETLAVVRPALREARPVSPRLARFLREFVPTARRLEPLVGRIRDLLPPLRRVLEQAPPIADVGIPAVRSLSTATEPLLPILGDIRPYVFDVAYGVFGGQGGSAGGLYDANGQFVRIPPHLTPQALGAGALQELGVTAPRASGLRTGLTARCPGAADDPAEDGSNPIVPEPPTCNPDHGLKP